MIKLNRIQLFLAGVLVIFLFVVLNKYSFWSKSEKTTGIMLSQSQKIKFLGLSQGTMKHKSVRYIVKETPFIHYMNADFGFKVGDKIPIIYNSESPKDAYVNTFLGFWMNGILYAILPLLVWAAFAFSFLDSKSKMEIPIPLLKQKENNQKMLDQ